MGMKGNKMLEDLLRIHYELNSGLDSWCDQDDDIKEQQQHKIAECARLIEAILDAPDFILLHR